MERASDDELKRMVHKPCPVCGVDRYYFMCHGVEDAKVIGDKMCPLHAASMVKNCLMVDPGSHMI